MKPFKLLYVYILRCTDNSYYAGITNNTEIRVEQHNQGADPAAYTYSRRPVELVYVEYFSDFRQAIAREKQIKGWTRKKKEALIEQNSEMLRELSACKNETSHLFFKKEGKSGK